jgi:hypothetical protein
MEKKEWRGKEIRFPFDSIIITIPEQEDESDIFVEVKDVLPEDWISTERFTVIEVPLNFAFYVLDEDGKFTYKTKFNNPITLEIKYDIKTLYEARKAGSELKLQWKDRADGEWKDFDNEPDIFVEPSKGIWVGYGKVEINTWPDDPPIGWGC